jgi:predicted nucleotidyltransferase
MLDTEPKMVTIEPIMGSTNILDQLASALFGKTKRAVLALLLTHPQESFYLRQIVRSAGLGQGTVQRELQHLTEAGLLLRRQQGHQVYYQANQNSPIFKELKSLLIKTAGVGDILRQVLSGLKDRIEAAFLYGSFATGKDRPASDLDLAVIGNVTFGEVVSQLRPAQETLGREINPTVYAPDEFQKKLKAKHHFVSAIIEGPKIMLIGEERELTRLGKKRLGRKT